MTSYISSYIEKCIIGGITSGADILGKAQAELSEIESEIRKLEELKIQRNNLQSIVRHLTNEEKKPEEIAPKEQGKINQDLCNRICDYIKLCGLNKQTVTPRSIMDKVSSSSVEHRAVYGAYKSLLENGMLTQTDDDNRFVSFGPNWKEEKHD